MLVSFDLFAVEGEIIVHNYSYQKNIRVQVFPVGAVFNGDKKYRINCAHPRLGIYDKIIGGSKILNNDMK